MTNNVCYVSYVKRIKGVDDRQEHSALETRYIGALETGISKL